MSEARQAALQRSHRSELYRLCCKVARYVGGEPEEQSSLALALYLSALAIGRGRAPQSFGEDAG